MFGGKGLNQAVACSKLAGESNKYEVVMLGQVGKDAEGYDCLNYLQQNGIDNEGIIMKEECCTGQAFIMTSQETGDNSIIIVGGAN